MTEKQINGIRLGPGESWEKNDAPLSKHLCQVEGLDRSLEALINLVSPSAKWEFSLVIKGKPAEQQAGFESAESALEGLRRFLRGAQLSLDAGEEQL